MFKHLVFAALAVVVLGASVAPASAQGYGPGYGRMGQGMGRGGCMAVCRGAQNPDQASCWGAGGSFGPGQSAPDGSLQKQSFVPGSGKGRAARI